ncbi:MAG: glycosyltransferase [Labilithrix sp.]|nr:glycosyltransferase [Labilithrix sp.]
MPAPVCSIIILTYRRPEDLAIALESTGAQRLGDPFEVIVVDNSPEGSAQTQVERFAATASHRVIYVSEKTPGISSARNAGLGVARGELIAFLDDDQVADPEWLERMIAAQRANDAEAVFGWVEPYTKVEAPPYAEIFFDPLSRRFEIPSGRVPPKLIAKLGTNNSLFRASALDGKKTFDPTLNLTGGEDSAVIKKIAERGGTLVWCKEGRVREHVPPDRLRLGFLLERRFSSGQLRSRHFYAGPSRSYRQLAKWVAIGAVQATGGALLASSTLVVAPVFARKMLAEAAGGLGKVFFLDRFVVERYRRPPVEVVQPTPAEAAAEKTSAGG